MAKWNTDRIIGISAILISLGSLFIIVYQTQILRESERAAVMPYLELGMSVTDAKQSIVIGNTGLGPAFIKSIDILEGNESIYEGPPSTFAKSKVTSDTLRFDNYFSDLILPGMMIPPGIEKTTFSHDTEGALGQFIKQHFKFTYNRHAAYVIRITYESVYGDVWIIRSDAMVPVEVH